MNQPSPVNQPEEHNPLGLLGEQQADGLGGAGVGKAEG